MFARASDPIPDVSPDQLVRLTQVLGGVRDWLPRQGPLGTFVAQNPLAFLESKPFGKAMATAAALFRADTYLSEASYRDALACGRISADDVDAVLADEHEAHALDCGASLCNGRLPLTDLHRLLLLYPVHRETDAGTRWALTEQDLVERLREDLPPEVRWQLLSDTLSSVSAEEEGHRSGARQRTRPLGQPADERAVSGELWHACIVAISQAGRLSTQTRTPLRHRDLIRAIDPTIDTDQLVDGVLVRWCAAFLDQGVAGWSMPDRDRGLLQAVARAWSGGTWWGKPWARRLPQALREAVGRDAAEVSVRELIRLGVPEHDWHEYVRDTLLALPGWAGMMRQLEDRPDLLPAVHLDVRLIDFVALRLICDRVAAEWAAGRLGPGRRPATGPLSVLWTEWRDHFPAEHRAGTLARALTLHQVAQLAGLSPADIRELDENELLRLEQAIHSFDGINRRRLLHLAYERHYRSSVLNALAVHGAVRPVTAAPRVQAVFCMDERCESFRRHLEELGPDYETFGAAGFFGVPMSFRGLDDWHPSPLCPISMRPAHFVHEEPAQGTERRLAARRLARNALPVVRAAVTSGSLGAVRGGFVTALLGATATIPLVARVLFPRLAARMFPPGAGGSGSRIRTRLVLEQQPPGRTAEGLQMGFDVVTMAQCVRRALEDIGLTGATARLVAIIGHGSTSANNPHESAYHCGACGGRPGGANARALALMANDPRVRRQLAAWGLHMDERTFFVGGMLDTCTDVLTWYDEYLLPGTHHDDMRRLIAACRQVSKADAHERCRRFDSVPLHVSQDTAFSHVATRAVDIAQVRPELGHATNAVCIIGRRSRSRGLFLDRRAFLVSYDPTADADAGILSRTLAGVCPVASGINLAYYFSKVDPRRFGCGTKLPHNITGLMGVMDGHASDLRTGLPWQTVEIHEPMRLLLVVDAEPERILAAADREPAVRQLFDNGWIQLVAWSPSTGHLMLYEGGRFRQHDGHMRMLPVVDRSITWYRGKRDHLQPAQVLAALATSAGTTSRRGSRSSIKTSEEPAAEGLEVVPE